MYRALKKFSFRHNKTPSATHRNLVLAPFCSNPGDIHRLAPVFLSSSPPSVNYGVVKRMADATALANIPSMRPPPDLIPNFADPDSLSKWVVLCAAMCLVTVSLLVGIRMYTKYIITQSLDWADCMLLHFLGGRINLSQPCIDTCCLAWVRKSSSAVAMAPMRYSSHRLRHDMAVGPHRLLHNGA